ncbi:MAG: sulfite exporter TauE/SafE family protein [Candidatus Tectomicrobia bacterium]|nr:sulfite exporter TauE/SafE family protein [Candidatus Tectomicrobia bacterium]
MTQYLWLVPMGFLIGAYGTLIGAGGGFVLVPFLLLVYPHDSPETITSISLAVVFFNALSGTAAYARAGRVDYRSGLLFSIATVPGAVLGALTTAYIPRRPFDAAFGVAMIAVAVFLVFRPVKRERAESSKARRGFLRRIIDAEGRLHTYSYDPKLGVGLSFFVGYVSSLSGTGGGPIHVPVLTYLLDFPVHIATATSHFTIAIMAFTGTLVHIATGAFYHGVRRTLLLSIGVLLGAQLGAYLSRRVQGIWIIRGLAIAMGIIGIRLLLTVF